MVNKPERFGPSLLGATGINAPYPPELRRQLWPLCCGASILSGFKEVNKMTDEELVEAINHAVNVAIPDMQVYSGEAIRPALTFLTLNSGQMGSAKIMAAIGKAGFVKFAEGTPRGSPQGFFFRDTTGTFKVAKAA